MRGTWDKKCLENYGRRVVDRAETLEGVVAGREFGVWVDNLLNIAEVSLFFLAPAMLNIETDFIVRV